VRSKVLTPIVSSLAAASFKRGVMNTQATTQDAMYAAEVKTPAYHAYRLLHFGFVVAPILAGVDKFFNKLTDWTMYLWSPLGSIFGTPRVFMEVVGVIEIVAGFLVLFVPRVGACIVGLWLWGIIANLLLGQGYYDIALRDFGLSLGAFALQRLATYFHQRPTPGQT